MNPFGEVTLNVTGVPAVIAALEKAERLIAAKDVALMAWIVREHPDDVGRSGCPELICRQTMAAINAERRHGDQWR